MFHRAHKKPKASDQKSEGKVQAQKRSETDRTGMNQTAVQKYAASQEETGSTGHSSNQNATNSYAAGQVDQQNKTQGTYKEAKPMNNPESQAKDPSQQSSQPSQQGAQARVDIPGNNFQRPGAAAGQQGRPAYPGSYPGASTPSYSSSASSEAANGRQLLIGSGITLSGEIESCDHLVVEGTVEAALKGANKMDIAETGAFYGTVEIEEADISGRFEGDIVVNGRLTIQSTGVIVGTVSYKELSMEAGAVLEGSVSPIGSQHNANAAQGDSKKAAKSKKVTQQDNGAELPFSGGAAAAAE